MTENNEHKVVQFFLTGEDEEPNIYEVRLIKGSKMLVCTCPGFRGRSECKHLRYVRDKLTRYESNNHYTLRLDEDTPEDLIKKAPSMSTEEYRAFVTKYGIIEVL